MNAEQARERFERERWGRFTDDELRQLHIGLQACLHPGGPSPARDLRAEIERELDRR